MKTRILLLVALLISGQLTAQVDAIKKAASSHHGGGSQDVNSSDESVAGFVINMMAQVFVAVVPEWHRVILAQQKVNPSVVSIETMVQVASQPSAYYVFQPRIRGNYGLFATDFRVNYLVQHDIDGSRDLTTYDWQIVQLNAVATRNVIGRVGLGIMAENFGARKTYGETTLAVNLYTNNRKVSGAVEYRSVGSFATGVSPRREFNARVELRVFGTGDFQTYATLGGVYQQYYEAISVWGMQGGLIFKIY